MTPLREAIVLPFALLTVAFLGGLDIRPAGDARWEAPSLFSLVLAVLLTSALIKSGTLAPDRLLHGSRSNLANANGMVVLVTLFGACAQLLHMLTPRDGLPLLLIGTLLFVLLVNALAAAPDRSSLLRSLGVVTGSAFVLKFIVLAALADPAGGRTKRVILAMFDLATLGTITQAPQHPASGYVAFFVALMFLIAVATLPSARRSRPPETSLVVSRDLS